MLLAACWSAPSPAITPKPRDEPLAAQARGLVGEPASGAEESPRGRIARAATLYQEKEYDSADALLRRAIEDSRFAALEDEVKVAAYSIAAAAALMRTDLERAWAMFDAANASPAALPDVADAALGLAVDLWQPERAIAPMRVLAAKAPEKLRALDDRVVFQLHEELRRNRRPVADRIAFLQALFDSGRVANDGRQPSGLWLELVRLHLEAGDARAAAAAARRVDAPQDIVALQVDRRFEVVVKDLDPAQLDVAAAIRRDTAAVEAAIGREPRVLDHVVALTYSYLASGRYADALAACDAALAKVESAAGGPPFDDADDVLVWIHDNRARALLRLGRAEEAIAVWERARRMNEDGGVNVSQAINTGALHAMLGRGQEALAAVADLGAASPFGLMQYHSVRVTALLDRPDDLRFVESLAYLREHRSDASGTHMMALVKTGALDEAAAALRARLADPEERLDALMEVQRYQGAPLSPLDAEWRARLRAIVARPDVVEAIAAVGRVLDVPLYSDSF